DRAGVRQGEGPAAGGRAADRGQGRGVLRHDPRGVPAARVRELHPPRGVQRYRFTESALRVRVGPAVGATRSGFPLLLLLLLILILFCLLSSVFCPLPTAHAVFPENMPTRDCQRAWR